MLYPYRWCHRFGNFDRHQIVTSGAKVQQLRTHHLAVQRFGGAVTKKSSYSWHYTLLCKERAPVCRLSLAQWRCFTDFQHMQWLSFTLQSRNIVRGGERQLNVVHAYCIKFFSAVFVYFQLRSQLALRQSYWVLQLIGVSTSFSDKKCAADASCVVSRPKIPLKLWEQGLFGSIFALLP